MLSHRIGYIRVSALDQHPERQLDQEDVDRVFTDTASSQDPHRLQLACLQGFVREGDTVVIQSMDGLASNLNDLERLIQEFIARRIRVEFVKEHLVFSGDGSLADTMLLSMMGPFGEFERSLVQERRREGVALAKQHGAYRGRKKALQSDQVAELRRLAQHGEPKTHLAKAFGISRETVYQYLREDS